MRKEILKEETIEEQRKIILIKQGYVESQREGLEHRQTVTLEKCWGYVFSDKKEKKGSSDERVNERECRLQDSFDQGKTVFTAPGFHQCLKEENRVTC